MRGLCQVCGREVRTYYAKTCSFACRDELSVPRRAAERAAIRVCTSVPGTRWLALTKGRFVLLDEEDFKFASGLLWYFQEVKPGVGYAARRKRDGIDYLHRVLLGASPEQEVDHRNRDELDCRRSNLRLATSSENNANRRKHDGQNRLIASSLKGVSPIGDRWRAVITFHGRTYQIGTFATELEAAAVYDAEAKKLFGAFAVTNF